MRAFFTYLTMEIKRTLKVIPYFLAGATVLILLLGAVAFSAGRLVYEDRAVGKISIGIILPKEDPVAGKAMEMIESMDSVGTACEFVYVNREEGEEGLKNGEYYCLMEVPSGFVGDIMNGRNTPVTVIFPENAGLEAALLKELTDAGAATLGISQAGIYAADELCILHGRTDSIAQVEKELNRLYLRYSLDREGYFRRQTVSASGDVSMAEYYGISAFVLFLLLLGIPASEVLAPHSAVFNQKLGMMGIGRIKVTAARYCAVVLLVGGAALAVSAAAVILGAAEPGVYAAAAVSCVVLAASAMILMVYELAGSPAAGVMALFFGTVIMAFLAGGLIPAVFLPESIKMMGQWMPLKLLMDAMRGVYAAPVPGALVKVCIMAAGCFLLTVAVRRSYE